MSNEASVKIRKLKGITEENTRNQIQQILKENFE